MEHVLEFKYFCYVLDQSGTDDAVCHRKVVSRRKVEVIKSLVNARALHLEYARVLHKTLIMPILKCGIEIMIQKEGRGLGLGLYMDNLKGLLDIRRMDKVLNAQIRMIYGVMKGLIEAFSSGSNMWNGE